jgi:CheY-like chemotaxis protein
VAAGVQEALDLAATSDTRFDLLFSDLRLPDGNGWDLLRRLEDGGRRPRQAAAISAWGSETDVAKSKSAGFAAHLVKPIAPQIATCVGLFFTSQSARISQSASLIMELNNCCRVSSLTGLSKWWSNPASLDLC